MKSAKTLAAGFLAVLLMVVPTMGCNTAGGFGRDMKSVFGGSGEPAKASPAATQPTSEAAMVAERRGHDVSTTPPEPTPAPAKAVAAPAEPSKPGPGLEGALAAQRAANLDLREAKPGPGPEAPLEGPPPVKPDPEAAHKAYLKGLAQAALASGKGELLVPFAGTKGLEWAHPLSCPCRRKAASGAAMAVHTAIVRFPATGPRPFLWWPVRPGQPDSAKRPLLATLAPDGWATVERYDVPDGDVLFTIGGECGQDAGLPMREWGFDLDPQPCEPHRKDVDFRLRFLGGEPYEAYCLGGPTCPTPATCRHRWLWAP